MSDIREKYLTTDSIDTFIKTRTSGHALCLCTDGYVSSALGKHLIVSTIACRGKLFMLRPHYLPKGGSATTSSYLVAIQKQLADIGIDLKSSSSRMRWFMSDRASTNTATLSAMSLLASTPTSPPLEEPPLPSDEDDVDALGTQRATVEVSDLRETLHVPCVGHLLKTVLDRLEAELKKVLPSAFEVLKDISHMFYNAYTRKARCRDAVELGRRAAKRGVAIAQCLAALETLLKYLDENEVSAACEQFVTEDDWAQMNWPSSAEVPRTPEALLAFLTQRLESENARLQTRAPCAQINDTRWLSSVWMAFVYVATNWEDMCDFVRKEANRANPPPSVKALDALMKDPLLNARALSELEEYRQLCQPMANCLAHFSDHSNILACDVAKHIRELKNQLEKTQGLSNEMIELRARMSHQLEALWAAHGTFFEFAQWLAPGNIFANGYSQHPRAIPSAIQMVDKCNIDCLDWWDDYVAAAPRLAKAATSVPDFWATAEIASAKEFPEEQRGIVIDCLHVPPTVTNVDSIFSIEKRIMADKGLMTDDHAARFLQMHVAMNNDDLYDGAMFVWEEQV